MRLVIVVENMKSFFSFAKTCDLIFRLNSALGNASGNLIMVKLSSWMTLRGGSNCMEEGI
jgi:hypothetical protein